MSIHLTAFRKLVAALCVVTSFFSVLAAQVSANQVNPSPVDQTREIATLLHVAGYHLSLRAPLVMQALRLEPELLASPRLADYSSVVDSLVTALIKRQQPDSTLVLALARLKANSPEGYALAGQVLDTVAYSSLWQYKDEQAAVCYREAATIHLELRKFDDACWSLLNYGEARKRSKKYAAAKDAFQRATSLLQAITLLPDYYTEDQLEWRQLKGYKFKLSGDIHNVEGNYRKAIQNTEISLRLERNGKDNEDLEPITKRYVADYHLSLGKYYYNIGDFERSQSHFAQAKDLDDNFLRQAGNNWLLSVLALKRKDYELAQNYLNTCLELLEHNNGTARLKIQALVAMSTLYQESGEYEKARAFSYRATRVPVADNKYLAWSSLGASALKQGKYPAALRALDRARKAFQRENNAATESLGFLAELYRLTGDTYLEMGAPEQALPFFQQALVENHWNFKDTSNFAENPALAGVKDPIYFIKALSGKAKALSSLPATSGYNEAGIETFSLAIKWMDSLRTGYTSEATMLGWSAFYKSVYENAISAAYDLYQKSGDAGYLERAFTFAEKSKNAILLEQIQALKGKSYAGIPPRYVEQEKDLLIDLAYYKKLLRALGPTGEEEKRSRYQTYLAQTQLELAALQEELERNYPRYREIKYGNESPDLTQVRTSLLTEETALISYFIGRNRAFAIAITPTTATMVELAPPNRINRQTQAFVRELLEIDTAILDFVGAFTSYNQTGNALYQTIFAPLEGGLPAAVKRLIIIPDAGLNGLPFSALPTKVIRQPSGDFGQQPYLLYDYQIQFAYSAALQLRSRENAASLASSESCLAFAPPYRSTPHPIVANARASFPLPLAGTAREVREIARFLTGTFDSTGTATKDRFLDLAGRYGILHLAMHGVADPQDPNGNHLVFTNLSTVGDSFPDNRLYHYEIANLKLSAQLVVLSACETGVGKYEEGEGVYSLARSFSYAGVPSVVMSLWKASDSGTSEIMPSFYEQLAAGMTKDQSLQRAKIDYLSRVNPENRHPYYWAAFVGLGEARAITEGQFSTWTWLGGIAVTLLILGLWGWRAFSVNKQA